MIRSRSAYTGALNALSKVLQDPKKRLASETLSATVLLVHYEVRQLWKILFEHIFTLKLTFVAMPGRVWKAHIGGARQLLQLRGSERHLSGFDLSTYMVLRGYLVSSLRSES